MLRTSRLKKVQVFSLMSSDQTKKKKRAGRCYSSDSCMFAE